MVMNGGRMEQFGTPEEVYARPASTFVASFIGSPPMNLLKKAPNKENGGAEGAILGIRPEHLDVTASGWALRAEAIETLVRVCQPGCRRVVPQLCASDLKTLSYEKEY